MNMIPSKVPAPSGSIPSATLASANSKAPAGKGGELGGNIPGFGSGKPDASTINGVGGDVGKSPAIESMKSVRGFTSGGIKAGKI